jgi:hypothetical protein
MKPSDVTFVICHGDYDNQTYASLNFDKWGEPLQNDIRYVKDWSDIHLLSNLKDFIFLCKSGCVLNDITLFFQEIKKHPNKHGFGHIIMKEKLQLHNQALLIHKDFLPKTFGYDCDIELPDYKTADKNIHDDYTPIFVSKNSENTSVQKNLFGLDIIAEYLKKEKYFVNFTNEMRGHKSFYYKGDEKFFDEYLEMNQKTLWIFNNEIFGAKDTEKVLTHASGVNWLFQLLQNKVKSLTLCDINQTQLKFARELFENWDGNNYGKFVLNFILKNKPSSIHLNFDEKQSDINSFHEYKNDQNIITDINNEFDRLIKKYGLAENFVGKWSARKEKEVHFNNENLLKEAHKFNKTEIVLSNILDYKHNFITNAVDKFENLLSPSTKAFIKKVGPGNNPYPHPPCKKFEVDVPVAEIHKEIESIRKYLVPHRADGSIGWSSFCIHGQSYDRTREETAYPDILPYHWTKEALENMPNTIHFLKSLPMTDFKRVRVMCLAPKGFIDLHRDREISKLGETNIAITQPNNCNFYLENHGIIDFKPGSAYVMNLVNYHAVVNYSNEYRYHMIIHGKWQINH